MKKEITFSDLQAAHRDAILAADNAAIPEGFKSVSEWMQDAKLGRRQTHEKLTQFLRAGLVEKHHFVVAGKRRIFFRAIPAPSAATRKALKAGLAQTTSRADGARK